MAGIEAALSEAEMEILSAEFFLHGLWGDGYECEQSSMLAVTIDVRFMPQVNGLPSSV